MLKLSRLLIFVSSIMVVWSKKVVSHWSAKKPYFFRFKRTCQMEKRKTFKIWIVMSVFSHRPSS